MIKIYQKVQFVHIIQISQTLYFRLNRSDVPTIPTVVVLTLIQVFLFVNMYILILF